MLRSFNRNEKRNNKNTRCDICFPCGGGGLWLNLSCQKFIIPFSKLIGAEPENANDATNRLQSGEIKRFEDSPKTIADGESFPYAKGHFDYLKNWTVSILVVKNQFIIGQQLMQTTKVSCEPSITISMSATYSG